MRSIRASEHENETDLYLLGMFLIMTVVLESLQGESGNDASVSISLKRNLPESSSLVLVDFFQPLLLRADGSCGGDGM